MTHATQGTGAARARVPAVAASLVLVLVLGVASPARCAGDEETRTPAVQITSPTIEPLLRMGLALFAMGVAAWGLGAWARRRRIVRSGTDYRIDVLALKSLGPRQRIALIEVAERRFLVGIGADQIRPIADLSESIDFERQVATELAREEADERTPLLDSIGPFEGLDG